MTLGERIYQLRKAGGLSQEQLGDQLNVSRQAISKWELNESVPDIDKLIQIGRVFSISMDELLSGAAASDEKTDGTAKEEGKYSMRAIVEMNVSNKLISAGIWSTVIGLVMLVLEFLFLPVYMIIRKSLFSDLGFYVNAIEYAHVQPMPIVFSLTGLIVLFGLGLFIFGSIRKKRIG
jgi:transcriptional regulator with XRE-family HTH domain